MEREQTSPDYLRTLSPARPALLRGVWREGQALNLKQTINTVTQQSAFPVRMAESALTSRTEQSFRGRRQTEAHLAPARGGSPAAGLCDGPTTGRAFPLLRALAPVCGGCTGQSRLQVETGGWRAPLLDAASGGSGHPRQGNSVLVCKLGGVGQPVRSVACEDRPKLTTPGTPRGEGHGDHTSCNARLLVLLQLLSLTRSSG